MLTHSCTEHPSLGEVWIVCRYSCEELPELFNEGLDGVYWLLINLTGSAVITQTCPNCIFSSLAWYLYDNLMSLFRVALPQNWRLRCMFAIIFTLLLELSCLQILSIFFFFFLYKDNNLATSWENLFMPYANNKGADQRLCCLLPG